MIFNEFNPTLKETYEELKKAGIEIELNDEYKYLEEDNNFIDLDELYDGEPIVFGENEIEEYLIELGYLEEIE